MGHRYALSHLDGDKETVIQFVQRGPLHDPIEGVTNQEVLRSVIDRVKVLDSEKAWHGNDLILMHLRQAIALHESRALEMKISKGAADVEFYETGDDGHFKA